MNYDFEHTEFTKSLLSGVFAGITATILCLVFNAFFRGIVGFSYSEIINITSIIFGLMILVTVAGVIFYIFHHYIKKGTTAFQISAIVITGLLIFSSLHVQRSINPEASMQFRELLWGIIAITGVCTAFVIPFLYNHDYI